MDSKPQTIKHKDQSKSSIPAHLFVGNENQLIQTVTQKLQQTFCKQQSTSPSCFCTECRKVKSRQHLSIVWIEPTKAYLLSDLSLIFEKIRFALAKGERFFFILDKAHLLTPVCANRLLKTLEEPPEGYTFFLLTNNDQAIISTIRSRCYIHHLAAVQSKLFLHPLLNIFLDPVKRADPFLFEFELKKQHPSETETVDLIHDLIASIKGQLNNLHKKCSSPHEIEKLLKEKRYKELSRILQIFEKQLTKLPPPGGANLFWKKLFLLMQ